MRRAVIMLACALFTFVLPTDVTAQEAQQEQFDWTQPEKIENADWFTVFFVKFKPGKEHEGLEIIKNHFVPVDEQLGREGPTAYHFKTGEWDMVVYFPMEGPEELGWEISPSDAEWNRAFVEREGGLEEGEQVFEEFNETVAASKTELAMRRRE